MTIVILVSIIAVFIAFNFLRFAKYKEIPEPNSQVIIALLNNLEKKKISKK
jgi:hypothetical protein